MSKKIQLTVEDWCQLAKEGIAVPITTTLKGFSMEPLIRYMKDPITIIPVDRALIPGKNAYHVAIVGVRMHSERKENAAQKHEGEEQFHSLHLSALFFPK